MTRHNNMMGSFWVGIAIGTGALLIAEQLWRVLVPNENGLSIDTGNSINKNDYFSTELDEYNDDSVGYDSSGLQADVNYTSESTIDYSKYQDVEYAPLTHALYLKVEGTLPFNQVNLIDAPEGYQVDYSVSSEFSNDEKNNNVYGTVTLKFTNTEKVLVREYYDTATGKYVSTNFGTVVEKEKQKTIGQ